MTRRTINHLRTSHLDGDACPYCHHVSRVIERGSDRGAPYVVLEAIAVHVHGCPLTRMGKKHGPCTCGAVEIWERNREAMLAIVHPPDGAAA